MASKYDELYERFIESGLKIKEFCLSNNLNYHNVKLGFFQRRKIKEKNNINEQKVIKVN